MKRNKGFSLVELIIVIGIVAILAAVLAPTMIHYVERARAQQDSSAMGEVTNAIKLSLSDQDVYDELVHYMAWGNVSCYIDTNDENDHTDNKELLKDEFNEKHEQYMFNDDARLLDETVYYAAGNMRGVTITFQPQRGYYVIHEAIINKFLQTETYSPKLFKSTQLVAESRVCDEVDYVNANPNYEINGTVGGIGFNGNQTSFLYNRLKTIVGEKVKIDSNTYIGSEYTIFIRIGPIGGRDEHNQDAVLIYGQFNGTNLVAASN